MRVQVSKTMVKTLNKALKDRSFTNIERFDYDTLPLNLYQRFISDDIFTAEDYGDYNTETRSFKFIRVIYKPECYSVDRFITTYDLHDFYKHCDGTLQNFTDQLFNAAEI